MKLSMLTKIINLVEHLIWQRIILRFKRFFWYCIGGGMAFVTDAGLLFVFTDILKIYYLTSATLSFLIAACVNYSFQRFVTFKDRPGDLRKQFISFVLIAVVGLVINNSLLYLQVEFLGMWYMLAKAVAAVIVLLWNFAMNKYVTFK